MDKQDQPNFFSLDKINYPFIHSYLFVALSCGFIQTLHQHRDFTKRDVSTDFSTLILITSGDCSFTIKDNLNFHAKENDLLIIPPNTKFDCEAYENMPFNVIFINIRGATSNSIINGLTNKNIYLINTLTLPTIKTDFFDLVNNISKTKEKIKPFIISSQIYQLLCNVLDHTFETLNLNKVLPPLLMSGITFIDEHYKNNITLETIAEYCECSVEYFSRTFRKYMNMTVWQYVTEVRMNQAINLLSNTTIPIIEIADRLTYKDVTHFVKTFKKHTGLTPDKFRRQSRKLLEKR